MAVTYNLKGTTNPSFKIGKSGVTLTSLDGETLQILTTQGGATASPVIELNKDSASPFNADYLGQFKFKGDNSSNSSKVFAKISAKASDVTAGAEDGTIEFSVINNGSQDIVARVNENGLYLNAGHTLKFEGSTADTNETTLTVSDPTADRTITLPDATGTVALTDSFTRFHSATQTVTRSEASTNASTTVDYTFSDLSTAVHYNVFLNRTLLRPAEFSVSGSTLTINIGVIDTDDQLEVTGFKV